MAQFTSNALHDFITRIQKTYQYNLRLYYYFYN